LSEEDVEHAAEALEPNSTAVLIIWEDLWAAAFADALYNSGGVVLEGGRIPRDVIEAAAAAGADWARPGGSRCFPVLDRVPESAAPRWWPAPRLRFRIVCQAGRQIAGMGSTRCRRRSPRRKFRGTCSRRPPPKRPRTSNSSSNSRSCTTKGS